MPKMENTFYWDKSTSKSGGMTPEEKAQLNKATSDITSIETQLKDHTKHIADLKQDKQDKLVAGKNITIKGNVISATSSGNGGASFFEGQSIMFETKAHADKFIAKNNLTLNVDYKISYLGRFIMTGENGKVGGSNYIRVANLPNDGFNISIPYDNSSSNGNFKNPPRFKRSSVDGRYDGDIQIPFKLNSSTQNEFIPTHIERYEIIILRDI